MSKVKRACGHFPEVALLAALFLAVVLPAGGIALSEHFDGLYGQDPYAYLDYATGPLADSLRHLAAPPPFYWPPGYPLLLALASFVVGSGPGAGQLVSLLFGGLVPVITALLAGEVWAERSNEQRGVLGERFGEATLVPLVAGLFTALAGQLWQSSVVVMADTAGLALASLGVWAIVRYRQRGWLGWFVIAGAALAAALVTRWANGLVAIPCAVYAAAVLARQTPTRAIRHAGITAIVVGLILAPMLVPAFRALIGGSAAAPFATDLQVYSWSPLNLARRHFLTADGVLDYALPNGLYYALAPARPYFFTPLIAWLILPGLWSVARRVTPSSLLIVAWAAFVYAFHAGAPWQNFRFTLVYLPPLAVLAGFGAVTVDRWLRIAQRDLRRVALVLVVIVGLGWMGASAVALTRGFVARKDADLATAAWLQARLPANAVVLTFGFTLTLHHYTDVETFDLSETDPIAVSRLLSQDRPTFVFADVSNLETQWQGQAPEVVFHSLRDGRGFDRLGQSQSYTLFRVRSPTGDGGSGTTNGPP